MPSTGLGRSVRGSVLSYFTHIRTMYFVLVVLGLVIACSNIQSDIL